MSKIFATIFKYANWVKNIFFSSVLAYLKTNKAEADYFLRQLLPDLKGELYKYPSIFNAGYLHIEKAIEYSNYFKLNEKDLILDIGAANGATALLFRKAFPESVIYSFEPLPEMFELLTNAVSGFANIISINKGLGSAMGELNINLSQRITSSSFFEIEKNISNEFFSENVKSVGSAKVIVSTLDSEIPLDKNVNILKMDVQGFELEVLKGGIKTLDRTAIVLVEMQNHDLYKGAPKYYDIDKFLVSAGFELYDIIPSIRQDKKLYEWDSIYINRKCIK
jgi:FkbM family methyltransferase